MPLYEYRCEKCGKVFEKLQKFADEPLKVHEECGGVVERLVSSPAFHFKGSGFYITDYARSGSKDPGSKEKSSGEGKGEGKSEGKSESKSDAKTETKSETKSESKTESKPAPAASKSE